MPDTVLRKSFTDSTLAVDPELKEATQGATPAVELKVEELKNVDASELSNGDSIIYESASKMWKAKPAEDSETMSELPALSSLPDPANYKPGDMVNLNGELYELVDANIDATVYRGIVRQDDSGTPFYGDDVFKAQTQAPYNVRCYLPKSVLGSSPPTTFYVELISQIDSTHTFYTELQLYRAAGDDTSTTYAYHRDPQDGVTVSDEFNQAVGKPFRVEFYRDEAKTQKLTVLAEGKKWTPDKVVGSAGITVRDHGVQEGTEGTVNTLDFEGDGVSVSRVGGKSSVTVSKDTAEQVKNKLESLSGENRLNYASIKGVPEVVQTAGMDVLASTYTPSVAEGLWDSEQIVSIVAKDVDSEMNATLSNNVITFADAGFYVIEGAFYVESNVVAGQDQAQQGNIRIWPEFYMKKNGVKDLSSDATFYVRGGGTYLGAEGLADHSYKITHAFKVEAGDTISLHVISKRQNIGMPRLILNGSQSEFKVLSVKAQKGDAGEFDFDQPLADVAKQIRIVAEEITQGSKEDKNLAFAASGNTFTIANPFPKVMRLTYNNDSSERDLYLRYSINVPLQGGQDDQAPRKLQIGTAVYPFSYYETDAGVAVYRTAVVRSSDRITAARTVNDVNVQFLDNTWAGVSDDVKAQKTLSKTSIQSIANSASSVHQPPNNPQVGQKIEMLNDYVIHGGSVLTAAEATGSAAGLYAGYLADSLYTIGSGDLGSIDPVDARFGGLLSYSPVSNNQAADRNKTIFSRASSGFNPTGVYINGTRYALTTIPPGDKFSLNGLDGSVLIPGHQYFVNVEFGSGSRVFPDVTLKQGKTYIWSGLTWIEEVSGQTAEEINTLINSRVPQQYRSDAVVTGGFFQAKHWSGTQAAYDALAVKDENTIYVVPRPSQ